MQFSAENKMYANLYFAKKVVTDMYCFVALIFGRPIRIVDAQILHTYRHKMLSTYENTTCRLFPCTQLATPTAPHRRRARRAGSATLAAYLATLSANSVTRAAVSRFRF